MTHGPTRREFLGSMAQIALLPLEQNKPRLILHNKNIWTVPGSAEFCDQLDFDAGPEGNLSDAESASGVRTALSEHLDEKL
jgi:hypothetical protein